MKTSSLKRVALLLLTFFLSVDTYAQNGTETNQSTGIEFNPQLGSYYYQDGLASVLVGQFSSLEDIIIKENYILGSGDLISIDIDSNQPILLRGLVVNPQGQIVVPLLGTLDVAGQTILEAEHVISEKASETFLSPVVSISLERPRNITIYISGGVPFPGKHIVAPFSRVDEAIYGSIYMVNKDPETGLPELFSTSTLLNNDNFSFRGVEITRSNGEKITADLVSFFKTGSLISNPMVQDGDQITVRRITEHSQTISISGAVSSAQNIEFRENDTISSLIEIAGGLTPQANSNLVHVFRNNGEEIEKNEVSSNDLDNFNLEPNDRIVIPIERDINRTTVATINGEVLNPGQYPIIDGSTTAYDLLEITGGLTDKALPSAAYLIRGGQIENQVPNKFNIDLMKRTSDQLAQGFEYLELETNSSRNRVYLNLDNEEELKSIYLFSGDYLYIPRDENTIFVFGQVNTPGYYPYNSNISVPNYIQKAGGFALSADTERVFILKSGLNTWYRVGDTELESGDKIFIDRIPFDELNSLRSYEIQQKQERNTRIQLIMTGITTITGIITTYVAVTR